MRYPQLNVLPITKDNVDVFGGYNHNLRIKENEFYDMKNMTSEYYPVLSPRSKRKIRVPSSQIHNSVNGIIGKDTLCYVDGAEFVIGETRTNMGLTNNKKILVSMGAYVIILPDKKWINTTTKEWGNIEVENTIEQPHIFPCTVDGITYPDFTYGDSPIPNPPNGQLWCDTSEEKIVLRIYREPKGLWEAITDNYVKIVKEGIGVGLKQYDSVEISGFASYDGVDPEYEGYADLVHAFDGNRNILWCDDNSIVIDGIIPSNAVLYTLQVTVSRKMPRMDFVVESENRLWGCRHGIADNGEIVNEIYASKLGDFKNWSCYMGISTDSYTASCGTDGDFTGAVTYQGRPMFFKEDCVHKIYGSQPSNFQIQTSQIDGVQKGSGKSLAIVNNILYYKSKNGVCAYDGSAPVDISSAFGDKRFQSAEGGGYGNKYVLCMSELQGGGSPQNVVFVYDTAHRMWHREDYANIGMFCTSGNGLYYVDANDGQVKSMFDRRTSLVPDNETVEWMVTTGQFSTNYAQSGSASALLTNKKYISKLDVRMSLDIGAKASFYIQYDSEGAWEYVGNMIGTKLRSFYMPIRPKRCDHFRIKIEGEGDAKIYSIAKFIEQGSDL